MITLRELTKRYGDKVAVDRLTIDIRPGLVTGFLGPNGSGKSTTMRMIVGLDHPTSGTAEIDGKPYAALTRPVCEVGTLLDAKALHPGRTARMHLLAMARSNGIAARRVDEVLELAGLASVARKRVRGFSLGMFQRLGIAGALLGDPRVLILDEPVNGLDPDGVRWIRELVRAQAAEGRTVFISSHLMSEMQLTADQLVIIGRGRLIADAPIGELIAGNARAAVKLRSPDSAGLAALRRRLAADRIPVDQPADGALVVRGRSVEEVGDLAYAAGLRLHELRVLEASLEQAYMDLTADSVEFPGPAGGAAVSGADAGPAERTQAVGSR